jgi:hypothetical protein
MRSSVTWQKQALYSEVSKPTRIGHSIRHKIKNLFKSQLAIVGIVAERVIRLYDVPNGGERLVHHGKRLRIVNVRSVIWRGHRRERDLPLSATSAR